MKNIYLFLFVIQSMIVLGQVPQGFSYQATVRDNAGQLIINENVYFKFNIMQGNSTSLPIFSETHYAPTDDQGHVNLVVGAGTATVGTFNQIDWSDGAFFLGIELNTGNGYVAMGTTQLLSVPYALYAESSGSANGLPVGNTVGDMLYWNGSQWVTLAAGLPGQLLFSNNENLPTWGFNVSVTDVSCFGQHNGIIEIFFPNQETASNYSFQWSGPNGYSTAFQNIDNLAPGMYELTITEANGTQHDYSYVVNEPSDLFIELLSTTSVSCFGAGNGSVTLSTNQTIASNFTVNVIGINGTSFSNTYQLSGSSSITIPNLPGGDFQISIANDGNCNSNTVVVNISEPQSILPDLSGTYTLVVTNNTTGSTVTRPTELITALDDQQYRTQTTGTFTPAQLAPATDTGFTFRELCGFMKVDDQSLANYWANIVYQTEDQLANSTYNSSTGVITIHYTISFSAGDRAYTGIYTPN